MRLAAILLFAALGWGDRPALPFCALAAQHEGQPATCNNYRSNRKPCSCHRAVECGSQGEDAKCQVYCRPNDCKCVSPCDT